MHLIVAFSTKNFGIGKDNSLPWHIPSDIKRFAEITAGSIVVMGNNTWRSLKGPLKGRINVVVTKNPIMPTDEVLYVTYEELDSFLEQLEIKMKKTVFIIGGSLLYRKYLGIADKIYATLVDSNVTCDTFFPISRFNEYEIEDYGPLVKEESQELSYRFVTYTKSTKQHGEYCYLYHMKNILDNGDERSDRTGTGTKSVFGGQLRFDISQSIPILTTKFVPFQLTVKELLFFLRGQTDTKILENQGVNIWKGNTSREFLDKKGLAYEEGDMGPMYSFILCHCGADYKGCDYDYTGQGINQLEKLINGLKTDPWSRRHIMTTFSPLVAEQGVLYPCHGIVINAYYSERNNKSYVSLHVYIRSSDGFLGLPINILSYAILTYIIAKKCGYLPYELIISFGDAHIYNNAQKQVNIQLERNILPFPVLKVNDNIIEKEFKDIELSDFELIGYLSNPKITAPMAV